MSKTKYRFTYDEVRVIVLALVELKNQLIEEGRYGLSYSSRHGCGCC